MGVRGFAPSMAGGPCRPRSSSKIIAPNRGILGLGDELRKCVQTFHGRFVSCGNGEGIEVLAEPIFVRGLPLLWKRHCRPCAWLAHLASSSFKIIAPNRGALVFRNGLRKRVRTSHGRFVLCWERITVDSRICQIRFDPLFRLRPVFNSKIITPNREPLVFRNELRKC